MAAILTPFCIFPSFSRHPNKIWRVQVLDAILIIIDSKTDIKIDIEIEIDVGIDIDIETDIETDIDIEPYLRFSELDLEKK
jgi:hypothetical protein